MTKIIHCPYPTAGNPAGLSEAENSLGFISHTLDMTSNKFKYPVTFSLQKGKMSGWLIGIKKVFWAFKIAFTYDIVHYSYGSCLSPRRRVIFDGDTFTTRIIKTLVNSVIYPFEHWDVKLVKLCGKQVYVTYQGSDARQKDYCLKHFAISHLDKVSEKYGSIHGDKLKREWIEQFNRRADKICSLNPDLCWVLPERTEFTPYASVQPANFNVSLPDNSIPKILHAPSNRAVKGTDEILHVLDKLKSEGFEFELILVENMPNEVAKEIYAQADILVDQIYAGWYGGLAVELMAMGKIVLSYIRESDLGFIPEQMKQELPVVNSPPHELYEQLKNVLTMTIEERKLLGSKGRRYVENWHDPLKIVKQIYDLEPA